MSGMRAVGRTVAHRACGAVLLACLMLAGSAPLARAGDPFLQVRIDAAADALTRHDDARITSPGFIATIPTSHRRYR